jgi:hypothetical protein
MAFCPSCRAEYRAEFTRCADCDVELVDSRPAEDSHVIKTDEVQLAEVGSFPNASEAEMSRELLESNGISTVIRGDVDPIGAISGAELATLLVVQSDLARAREIYEAFFAGDTNPAENPEPQ